MIQWVQVTAGRGPAECGWVVARILECIKKEATEFNLKVELLDAVQEDSRANSLKSVLLALEGENVTDFLSTWLGTIQWIGESPFRPLHKRKNWFVGVNALVPSESHLWSETDLKFETMRSSGPGGQHVNKTETAVRVTHLRLGLSATAREERSQYLNRKLALSRLAQTIKNKEEIDRLASQTEKWQQHNVLERGNSVRTYEGRQFKLRNESIENPSSRGTRKSSRSRKT